MTDLYRKKFPQNCITIKTIFAIFMLLLFTSCITTRAERMNSWIGKDMNQLVYSKWGYPNETTEAPNGNKVLVYEEIDTKVKTKTVYKPRYSKAGALLKGTRESVDYTVEERCLTFFEIDDNSKVVNVHHRCQ
jgi:hypothetical protein